MMNFTERCSMVPFVYRTTSLEDFAEALAARTSAPGGGAASAYVAALASALTHMVAAFSDQAASLSAEDQETLSSHLTHLVELVDDALELCEKDQRVFADLTQVLALPKDDPQRSILLEEGLLACADVPYKLLTLSEALIDELEWIHPHVSRFLVSDVAVVAALVQAAALGAEMSVWANVRLMRGEEHQKRYADTLSVRVSALTERSERLIEAVRTVLTAGVIA